MTPAHRIGAIGALVAVHSHPGLTTYYRHLQIQAREGAQTAARMISLVPLAMGSAALLAGLEARFTVSRMARIVAGAGMATGAGATGAGTTRLRTGHSSGSTRMPGSST